MKNDVVKIKTTVSFILVHLQSTIARISLITISANTDISQLLNETDPVT